MKRPLLLFAVFAVIISNLPPSVPQCAAQELAEFPKLTEGQDWPWWRGPLRNGVAVGEAQLPVRFGLEENVLWKVPVAGRGHSSPIVVAGHVYLATADESQQTQSVLAFDLQSGQPQWQKEISRGGFPENNHAKNTEASATIASDGEAIFATFFHHRQIEVTALSLGGELLWQKSVNAFNPKKFEYGYAPSPVIYKNSIIISAEWDGDSNLIALDRRTGKQLWKSPRPSSISFSSPVVATVAGRTQLLISGIEKVTALNPDDGQPLWQVAGTTAATCGTMIWNGDTVFASGGYPKAETLAVRADGSGRVLWRNGLKCYEQSMIIVDGFIYALTDRGVLYCWRGDDGAEMWRERLEGPVSASPILAGGHIYWANEAGTMYVFRPNPERFELVAQNQVGNEAFASPAVSGNRLLLRVAQKDAKQRQEFLVCIGNP
ncbi:MAG: PQQ-binding-like beta-propeller repeat protein [Pirellulaceae bacterium]